MNINNCVSSHYTYDDCGRTTIIIFCKLSVMSSENKQAENAERGTHKHASGQEGAPHARTQGNKRNTT